MFRVAAATAAAARGCLSVGQRATVISCRQLRIESTMAIDLLV